MVDEYGVVVGVVTLENVLEEIVGAVQDEFDIETPEIVEEGASRWIVQGGTLIADVARVLELPLEARGVDTIAGLVLFALGKVPAAGDRAELEGVTAEVLEVQNKRATRLRLIKTATPTGGEAAGPRV